MGEMSSTSMENCYQYAATDENELSMVFSFHHLKVDFMGNEKWVLVPEDFQKLKNILFPGRPGNGRSTTPGTRCSGATTTSRGWCPASGMRGVLEGVGQNAGGRDPLLRGTPYIYQGEELGMTNAGLPMISQYRDVESLNHFRILQEKGLSADDAYRFWRSTPGTTPARRCSGTAGRTADSPTGSRGSSVNPNCDRINAEAELATRIPFSHFYRKLIKMRKEYDVIACGSFEPLAERHPQVFAYRRRYGEEELLLVSNFYIRETRWESGLSLDGFEKLLGNYDGMQEENGTFSLRPYETIVLYRKQ